MVPTMDTAPKIPNALLRPSSSSNETDTSARAEGASKAANAPCAIRAAMSSSMEGAAPPIAEATAKPTSPAMRVFFLPQRSPSRPLSNSRPPKVSAYPVIIHWRELSGKPSSA